MNGPIGENVRGNAAKEENPDPEFVTMASPAFQDAQVILLKLKRVAKRVLLVKMHVQRALPSLVMKGNVGVGTSHSNWHQNCITFCTHTF